MDTRRPPVPARARRLLPALAVSLFVLSGAAFVAGVEASSDALRIAAKPGPILVLALLCVMRGSGRYMHFVVAGLLASLVGDIVLELGPTFFLPGLVAFLIAHLFYIGAYLAPPSALAPARALPVALYGVLIYSHLLPHLDPMRAPVLVYTLVICTMLWRAAARVGATGSARLEEVAALAGAVLFVASDTVLAERKFVGEFPGSRYLVIVLYWLGQAGIALSAMKPTKTSGHLERANANA
jgi:alkenylglycerophosphocholine hydrolase